MIERFEPVDGSTLEDILLHQEMLLIKCRKLIEIVKRAANNSCCICCDSCLACDALDTLREIGVNK